MYNVHFLKCAQLLRLLMACIAWFWNWQKWWSPIFWVNLWDSYFFFIVLYLLSARPPVLLAMSYAASFERGVAPVPIEGWNVTSFCHRKDKYIALETQSLQSFPSWVPPRPCLLEDNARHWKFQDVNLDSIVSVLLYLHWVWVWPRKYEIVKVL